MAWTKTNAPHWPQRLAHDEHAPNNISARLANDEFYIAEQLLLHSSCLEEQDLVDIVENRSLDHVGSICQRETLSDTLTDAIVERGAAVVLGALLRNNGAKFSKQAWAKIHETASGDEKLLMLAGRRAGKTPASANDEKNKAASGPVDGVITEATLREVAKSNDMDGTVEQLATLMQQDSRFVRHCLIQQEIKALIIVRKAEDLSDDTFASLVQLRLQQRTMKASDVASAIKRYRDISVEYAQDFLSKRKQGEG